MKLRALRWTPTVLTLRRPVQNARAAFHERRGLLLQLTSDDGLCGRGEVTPLSEFGTESMGGSLAKLEEAAKRIAALQVPTTVEGVEQLFANLGDWSTAPASRFGLELCVLDLIAQKEGLPLARVLSRSAINSIEVNALLTSRDPEHLVEEAVEAVSTGYRTLKVKVGGCALNEDARRLFAVRRSVGPEPKIRIDANGQWTEAEAATALRGFAPLRLELCEQPVAPTNNSALRRLRWLVPCKIAADEALAQPGGVEALLESDEGPLVEILVLKPAVLGGILPSLRLARRADQLGVAAYVTSALDGVIARLGAAHLAAALPRNGYACGLGVGALFSSEPGPDPCPPVRGQIHLLEKPGLGVELGWGCQPS